MATQPVFHDAQWLAGDQISVLTQHRAHAAAVNTAPDLEMYPLNTDSTELVSAAYMPRMAHHRVGNRQIFEFFEVPNFGAHSAFAGHYLLEQLLTAACEQRKAIEAVIVVWEGSHFVTWHLQTDTSAQIAFRRFDSTDFNVIFPQGKRNISNHPFINRILSEVPTCQGALTTEGFYLGQQADFNTCGSWSILNSGTLIERGPVASEIASRRLGENQPYLFREREPRNIITHARCTASFDNLLRESQPFPFQDFSQQNSTFAKKGRGKLLALFILACLFAIPTLGFSMYLFFKHRRNIAQKPTAPSSGPSPSGLPPKDSPTVVPAKGFTPGANIRRRKTKTPPSESSKGSQPKKGNPFH